MSKHITVVVSAPDGEVYPLQLPPDAQVSAILEAMREISGTQPSQLQVSFYGRILQQTDRLDLSGITNEEVVLVSMKATSTRSVANAPAPTQLRSNPTLRSPSGPNSSNDSFLQTDLIGNVLSNILRQAAPQQQNQQQLPYKRYDASAIKMQFESDAAAMLQLNRNDPELYQAIKNSANAEGLKQLQILLDKRAKTAYEESVRRAQRIQELNANPFDPAAQQEIEELIRQENVQENMELAIEHSPEAFGTVTMLYINTVVNGVPVKAFVDTGAQMTIMNHQCALDCGIMRLLDKRFQGMAVGIGTQKILGRVHAAPIKIGNQFFTSSFNVLENQTQPFILGLDMLKRHQIIIDLQKNRMVVGTESVPFLSESDIKGIGEKEEKELEETIQASIDANKTNNPTSSSSTSNATPSSTSNPSLVPSTPPSSSSLSLNTPVSEFPEPVIKSLMDLGFPRDRVIAMLRMCNGNADLAASNLMF